MFRRSERHPARRWATPTGRRCSAPAAVAVVLAGLLACARVRAASPAGGDALADYLESSRLDRLLAVHLEAELARAKGPAKAAVARRLGEAYARLLESATDDDRRSAVEAAASRLLAGVPDVDTLDLRLTLARSAYARAEAAAEQWRLRLNSRADAEAARWRFADLERTFADLAAAAERRLASLEKQEEASTSAGPDRALIASAVAAARKTRSMAEYLAGWSAYYIAELEPSAAVASSNSALRHFGRLLNARPSEPPTLDRVPDQLLSYEHVARAVVGVAMCESLRMGDAAALRWLALLESNAGTPAAVAEQLPDRRMIILARASRWADLLALVAPSGRADFSLPARRARLLAVLALEGRSTGAPPGEVRPLLRVALGSLAAGGHTAQVADLASRYFEHLTALGETGFLASYIRGLREYDRARELQAAGGTPDGRPTQDDAARAAYRSAERFLAQALDSPDAGDFALALGSVALTRGLCRYAGGESPDELADAASIFADAADRLRASRPDESARAMLLSLRALDEAIRRAPRPDAAWSDRRRRLVDEFISRHASHPAAASLVYQRALAEGRAPLDAANELLTIPDDSLLAMPARHQAARLLYERWLAATADSKPSAAADFLAVAEPLAEDLRRAVDPRDAESASLAVATARRVVDCLLSEPAQADSAARARRALDLAASLVLRGAPAPANIHAEMDYRRVQIALLEDRWDDAEAARERLAAADSSLAAAADRAACQHAARLFRAAAAGSAESIDAARRVVAIGGGVIEQARADGLTTADPAVASLFGAVADAAALLWRAVRDESSRDLATRLYADLRASHPRDAGFLRAAAMHADAAGDRRAALDAWSALSSGLPPATPEWFEARCRLIELLIEEDPAAARAALRQHRVLYPDLGPPPWDQRIRELEARLDRPADSGPASLRHAPGKEPTP